MEMQTFGLLLAQLPQLTARQCALVQLNWGKAMPGNRWGACWMMRRSRSRAVHAATPSTGTAMAAKAACSDIAAASAAKRSIP